MSVIGRYQGNHQLFAGLDCNCSVDAGEKNDIDDAGASAESSHLEVLAEGDENPR